MTSPSTARTGDLTTTVVGSVLTLLFLVTSAWGVIVLVHTFVEALRLTCATHALWWPFSACWPSWRVAD